MLVFTRWVCCFRYGLKQEEKRQYYWEEYEFIKWSFTKNSTQYDRIVDDSKNQVYQKRLFFSL